jgi:pyruvate kinase
MVSVVWEADRILNDSDSPIWNQDLHDHMSPMEQELDAVAASAVRSARDMNAKAIILITATGRVARAVVRHRPTVPVLAFCLDPQVARRLQLHRSLYPIMLQSSLDPASRDTSMSKLRAEAVRVTKEMGYATVGDRIIMVSSVFFFPPLLRASMSLLLLFSHIDTNCLTVFVVCAGGSYGWKRS